MGYATRNMHSITWRVEVAPDTTLRLGASRHASSLNEASRFIPDGGYTTLRTYHRTGVILLSAHFDRMEESAALLGHPVTLNRPALRQLLCDVLRNTTWEHTEESRVRLTVDCTVTPGDIWLSIEPLPVPSPAEYAKGVGALTRTMHRDNPKAKYSAFIAESQAARQLLGADINEVLMLDGDNRILEGLTSNFFALYQGTLYTSDNGILPGMTRSLILEEVAQTGIPLVLEAPHAGWMPYAQEAFISSASRAILPVTRIDKYPVGNGIPGAVTRQLAERLRARLEKETESVCN